MAEILEIENQTLEKISISPKRIIKLSKKKLKAPWFNFLEVKLAEILEIENQTSEKNINLSEKNNQNSEKIKRTENMYGKEQIEN